MLTGGDEADARWSEVLPGSAAAARSYVEADHSRADDYYLTEGAGLAEHYLAGPGAVRRVGDLDGPSYGRWVAGHDVLTGKAKGRLRDDARALRFVEVVVNGPKSWSLAAALHPDIATAYGAAMGRAAGEVVGWVAGHATTRVGPRGRQVQVPSTATSLSPTVTPGPSPRSARTAACSSPATPATARSPPTTSASTSSSPSPPPPIGAQGETVESAHLALSETTGATSAYVGMTRGRHRNVAHLVAESIDDARSQWVDIFNRDRADLGPRHAAERAADDIDRYGPNAQLHAAAALHAAALRDHPRRPPPPIPAPPPASRGIGR